MPRAKGSRNKPVLTLDERIAQVTAEIESLQEQIKEKKAELKQLNDEKAKEDQKRLMAAVLASGKTVEELIEMISGSAQ